MRPNLTRNSLQKWHRKIRSFERYEYLNYVTIRQQHSTPLSDSVTSTPFEENVNKEKRPRWSYTPEALRMPISFRKENPHKVWECNSDPKRLNRFYTNFLGPGGDNLLSDEVKWLAITHKSFEQGARGFNDRLAFLGRRILNLQTDLLLSSSTTIQQPGSSLKFESDGREPFKHPALEGLRNLFDPPLTVVLSKEKLASFATSIGMRPIIRWYPRMIDNLDASGIETVLITSLYAIVGALALERGGGVSSDIVKNKILKPMGIP